MSKLFHIHFICTGNAYRSRLAEAYLKSLKIRSIKTSSSGLEATKHANGPICWYAARIAARNQMLSHLSESRKDTKEKYLTNADLVVFMHPDNHKMFRKKFNVNLKNYEIWNIPDLSHLGFDTNWKPLSVREERKLVNATEKTFGMIKNEVKQLIKKLNIIKPSK